MKIRMDLPDGSTVRTADDGLEHDEKEMDEITDSIRAFIDKAATLSFQLDNGNYIILTGRARENTIYYIEK